MMKKLFTLVALLTCFLGVKAQTETVIDYEKSDFTNWQTPWGSDAALERLSVVDGCIHFSSTEATANFWDVQFMTFGVENVENDVQYTITIRIKGSVAGTLHSSFSGSNTPGDISITTDWQDIVLEGCVNDPNAQYFAGSGNLLIQCGDYVGDWDISYAKITHEAEKEKRPTVWQEWITDDGNPIIPNVASESKYMGDAEFGQWPAWALETEGGINANWRGNRTGEICAWGLTMGRNFDDQCPADINSDSPRARPFPADIEEDPDKPGNHVFVVHVTEVADIEGGGDGSSAWSNQFWIQSPKEWKDGTIVKVKFRYKADEAASVSTQQHLVYPSNYLNSNGIGTLSFSTEWQEIEKQITVNGGCASIAFNLTDANKNPNNYYFDDLSWETMVLDEGYFVASANTTTAAVEYDYDNATEFVYDEGEDAYVATVGTKGKKDSWVNELMISTVRGNTSSFKSSTIKPVGNIIGNDADNWLDYGPGSQCKIKLPAAGVWQIFIAPDEEKEGSGQILFMELEGEEIVVKDPVNIETNTEKLVVNALEREPNSTEQPADEEAGTPAGTGADWDNQFWIVANREFEANEETVVEFDYYIISDDVTEAKVSSQGHGEPGAYKGGGAGDITFTTEEQHFVGDFKIPEKDWQGNAITGVKSLAFNMAIIRPACTYVITNVKWYLKGDENAEGKTMENLIKATGKTNFAYKVVGGEVTYFEDPSGIFNAINNTTTGSTVIYNLAGQRVSKDYKGIVIMNGKKYVVK